MSKCQYSKYFIQYLGFQLIRDKIKVTNKKVAAVQAVPPPENAMLLFTFHSW